MHPPHPMHVRHSLVVLICVAATTVAIAQRASSGFRYGGGPQQNRYSPLKQIDRSNVKQLEVAWTYDTGEPGAMQTQPVVVDGVLYGYTPTHKAFALDAATGSGPNRGVMYWASG